MWFLHSSLLWALPAALAPVLIHFISLRKARRVPFSDLRLLRAAYARSLPTSRLRRWLLLAARCAILAGLILAFARPVLRSDSSGVLAAAPGEESTRLVVLADVSYSMGYRPHGRTRLELAVGAAQKILRGLKPHDRVAALSFSDRIEKAGPAGRIEWSSDAAEAGAFLEELRPGFRTTDFIAALQPAYAFLRDSGPGRKAVLLLSDGAAHGWRREGAQEIRTAVSAYDPSVMLFGLRWDGPAGNAALTSAELLFGPSGAPGVSQDRPELQVRAWLAPGDGAGGLERELEVRLGEERVDLKRLRLTPGRETETAVRLSGERAWAWGLAGLQKDALAADDVFYYSFWLEPRPRILMVQGGPRSFETGRGGYFLKKLFADVRGGLLPYRAEMMDVVQARRARLSEYAAVVLFDFREFDREFVSSLDEYLRSGGGLWIIPGKTQDPSAWRGLDGTLPARVGMLDGVSSASGLRPERPLSESGSQRRLSWTELDLQNVSFRRRYVLDPHSDAQVWFRDGAGRPMLLQGRRGAGRVLLSAAALDLDWGNLALKPAFAPIADAALGYLTGFQARREPRMATLGAPLVRRWSEQEPLPASAVLRDPSGKRVPLQVMGRKVEYETDTPGIHRLELAGSAEPEFTAVNLDHSSRESDLRPTGRPPWNGLRVDASDEDFMRALYGRELRDPLLAGVLLLLALEVFLANASGALRRAGILGLCGFLWFCRPVEAQEGDKFVWSQLRYDGNWDPYPSAPAEILGYVSQVTSVLPSPQRRSLTLADPLLFSSPFLVMAGTQALDTLGDDELTRLRAYLTSGGFLWIEDVSGLKTGAFDRWVRRTLHLVFPDSDLRPLAAGHVVHKTFFLMRDLGGRVAVSKSLEGVDWGGRTVVLYSRNDVLGAWAKDALGKPLFDCVPGGEAQRADAKKLALNIVMYALTSNYKSDAVHQPFLLEKMRSGTAP